MNGLITPPKFANVGAIAQLAVAFASISAVLYVMLANAGIA